MKIKIAAQRPEEIPSYFFMSRKKILILMIILQWLFVALAVVSSFYEEKNLQGKSAEILKLIDSMEYSEIQFVLIFLAFIATMMLFCSSVAICFSKKFAIEFYIASYFIMLAAVALINMPFYIQPIEGALSSLSTLATGITMALLILPESAKPT